MEKQLQARYLTLLSALIACDSSNPPGLEFDTSVVVADFFGFDLSRDGKLTRREDCPKGITAGTIPVQPERYDLWFRLDGATDAPALALTGHMDVVPVGPEERHRWLTDPFEPVQKDGRVYGRGSTDMKSGLAAAMLALKLKAEAVAAGEPRPQQTLYLLATVDEEADMLGSRTYLQKAPWLNEIGELVVCEPTGLELCVQGRGRTYGVVTLHGGTGHGSHGTAGNLIYAAAKFLTALEQEDLTDYHDDRGSSFWQCLAIHACKEPCVVPDELTLTLDARLAVDHPVDEIWARMRKLLERTFKDTTTTWDLKVTDRRQGWTTPADSPFRQKVERAIQEVGLPLTPTLFGGSTDASKLREAGMEALIIGPGDLHLAHRENESVSVQEALNALTLYRHLIDLS